MQCGIAMDLLDAAAINHQEERSKHRQAHLETIRNLREQSAAASKERMESFMREEQARQTQIKKQKENENTRILILGVIIAIGILLFVGGLLVLLFFFG